MTTGFTLKEVATTIQPGVAYSLGSLFTTEPTTDLQGATGIDFSNTSTQGWTFSAILGTVTYPSDFGASAGYTINNVPASSSAGTDAQFFSYDGAVNGEPGIDFEPLANISITFSQSFLDSHPSFTLANLPGLSISIQDQFESNTFGGSTGPAFENSFNNPTIDFSEALSTGPNPNPTVDPTLAATDPLLYNIETSVVTASALSNVAKNVVLQFLSGTDPSKPFTKRLEDAATNVEEDVRNLSATNSTNADYRDAEYFLYAAYYASLNPALGVLAVGAAEGRDLGKVGIAAFNFLADQIAPGASEANGLTSLLHSNPNLPYAPPGGFSAAVQGAEAGDRIFFTHTPGS